MADTRKQEEDEEARAAFAVPVPVAYTEPSRLQEDFVSRGFVALPPEALGVDPGIHEAVIARQAALRAEHPKAVSDPMLAAHVPEILDVLNAPGLVAACESILGPRYAIAPFTHNGLFPSGGRAQHWHKDDSAPLNARKQRHHQAIQAALLYYPQVVDSNMGPTTLVPFSQYWTLNHETNHENFAGPEHLDFDYMVTEEKYSVTGPKCRYSPEDVQNRCTHHDLRMQQALLDTCWPLIHQCEAAPLQAGSVVLCSHNLLHRGSHRRDDWHHWLEKPRHMWRFYLYRTMEPAPPSESEVASAVARCGCDRLASQFPAQAHEPGADVFEVWNHQLRWMRSGATPSPCSQVQRERPEERVALARQLSEQLGTSGVEAEPKRIGAAYRLASLGDPELASELLGHALLSDQEEVRRAATYGLVALGPASTAVLLRAAVSQEKWVRRAGVYGLGDAAHLTQEVLDVLEEKLPSDPSVYVRAVAAGSVGCLGRRAATSCTGSHLLGRCMQILLASLRREHNRPAMDAAQRKMIKFVRPTDDCDVCEGSAVREPLGLEAHFAGRFERGRSAVREHALWAVVILCSQGASRFWQGLGSIVEALADVARRDKNAVCVGFAVDALHRLATHAEGLEASVLEPLRQLCVTLRAEEPVCSWE
eukprot:CAMPEP_0177535234 /NCGR_PEP_ID=MMETSP0369-20130122/56438_1 /TAXON_ID=447022 ORGANISM="Scrippsiella hangoei-like, Strain SHHI-4" /NCGR_SAMPLE_ID=MMETSP0369 /ASSEMBLY_ACC=CAM_ASM_000364 /LENGTH=648 /DNA_ID=CAMNT_0019017371 /DNA_START=14 /DNA_END=1957 /DNA_ORIENTATION=-